MQPRCLKIQLTKPLNSMQLKEYQSIISTIMYLILLTKPNVAFTLQWLLISLASPYLEHLNVAKNLLKYLAGTQNLAIIYKGNPKNNTKGPY